MSDSENESQCEYESGSEYESESEYDETYLSNQISKFNYFKNCDKCNPVKNIQKILLDKCVVLHNFKNQIVDYYGCDKCCKLRNLFDDYILPFTKLNKYPEYGEVHEIMRHDVQKKDCTLELHNVMKTIYENLDEFDFYKWHQEKMNHFKDTLRGYFYYYQRVYHIFIKMTHDLHYDKNRDNSLTCEYLEETTDFLDEMIVQKSK